MHKAWKGVLIASLVLNLLLAAAVVYHMKQERAPPRFPHLSPEISRISVEEFLTRQHQYSASLRDLRAPLEAEIKDSDGKYGIYVEDLTTGAWLGINEREQFLPMSLLKVPLLIAVLKKVETRQRSLDDKLIILPEDIDTQSGSLGAAGAGRQYTLGELNTALIQQSDNTAALTLRRRVVTDDEYLEAGIALGLSLHRNESGISPKEYANILRSLYYSSYLRPPFSEMALDSMTVSSYGEWLPAGIPDGVVIAHKVGHAGAQGIYHDCGIVYLPQKPYLICTMSKDTTLEEATRVMQNASRITYQYMAARAATTQ